MPCRVCELLRTRGSGDSGARSSSSVLTDSAWASLGRWSSARRRFPDSSRLNVEMSMLARAATSSSVSPCCMRSSRSRRRTRASKSPFVPFACMANQFGIRGLVWASSRHGQHLGLRHRRRLIGDAGEQSNPPAHGIGGLLGHDGRPPAEFYAAGGSEVAAYPSVEYRTGEVVGGLRVGDLC